MDLKNKVAIVTGGGSGLGEATAISGSWSWAASRVLTTSIRPGPL
jgi:NADP-dependent 3-hydroxy acid dehydrogenase YdfG